MVDGRFSLRMTSDLTDLRTFLARIDELLHLEEQLDDDEVRFSPPMNERIECLWVRSMSISYKH